VNSVAILGCRVDTLTASDAVRRIGDLAQGETPALVVTLGTEMIVRAQHDARFREVLSRSALSLCDTIGVMFAARLYGIKNIERCAGIDLIDPLCETFAREGRAIFLLGGKGKTGERAATVLRARHPGLIVAGTHDGYFPDSDGAAVAATIASSGAQVLFAGLGSPRQEIWITDYLKETRCAVGIGIGGSFDIIAGNIARAPSLWRRLNLEWLYRLIREPRRWRRQLALPHFVWLALRERTRPSATRRLS